jgi:uncharacterized delta-60 repeat protein
MPRLLLTLGTSFALFLTTAATAQPGSLDLSFNPTDIGFGQYDGLNKTAGSSGYVKNVALMPDGRIVMVGNFYWHDNQVRSMVTRAMPNGEMDESFVPVAFAGGAVVSVAVQPDGKILVGGSFETADLQPRLGLARLNEDGSLDTSFDIGAGFAHASTINASVNFLELQPDGKVICAGSWDTVDGVAMPLVARLTDDGSLDETFAIGTGFNGLISDLALQPDGMVLVSGWFDEFNGVERDRIARLTPTGALDASFAPAFGGGSGGTATMDLRPDGKIWFGGNWTSVNGQPREKFVLLTATGATDPSFVPPPAMPSTFVNCVVGRTDGSLVVGWHINEPWQTDQQFMTHYFADGTEDPLFSGPDFNGDVEGMLVDAQDRIMAFGWFTRYGRKGECAVTRLLSNGSVDPQWRQASAFDLSVLTLVRQPDGKLLCGGLFVAYDHRSANHVARLDPEGTHDTTFYADGIMNDQVNTIARQSDGKLLVGGRWYPSRMVRLNTDGSIDPTFSYGGPNVAVARIFVQPDGKALVAVGNSLVRLLSDGSLDPGFDTGTGFNGRPNDLSLLNDGRIVVIGGFTTFNDEPAPQIIRLFNSGARDLSFDAGTGFGGYDPRDIERQPDGKFLIAGNFTEYNELVAPGLVRIQANGSYDATFNVGAGTDEYIDVVRYGPDGRIYIGGSFTTVNGSSSPGLARLTAAGSFDAGFNVGTGTFAVTDLLFGSDNNLIIVGAFTSYDGIGRNRIARIIGGLSTGVDEARALTAFSVAPNPSNGQFAVHAESLGTFTDPWLEVIDVTGRTIHQQRWTAARQVLDLNVAPGQYNVVLRDGPQRVRTVPMVVQ